MVFKWISDLLASISGSSHHHHHSTARTRNDESQPRQPASGLPAILPRSHTENAGLSSSLASQTTQNSTTTRHSLSENSARQTPSSPPPVEFLNPAKPDNYKFFCARTKTLCEKQFISYLADSSNEKIESLNDARAFINCLLKRDDKLDTLSRLTASRNGLRMLSEAVSIEKSQKFVQENVIPLIGFIGHDNRMTLGGSLRALAALKFLLAIYTAPELFSYLIINLVLSAKLGNEETLHVGWLLLQVVKSGREKDKARERQFVDYVCRTMSVRIIPGGRNLREQLALAHQKQVTELNFTLEGIDLLRKNEAGWRHDNDKQDFREISVYPTAHELLCTVCSRLPESCDVFNRKRDAVSYLDWAFRLLREDVIRSVKEEVDLLLNPIDALWARKMLGRFASRTLEVVRFSEISTPKNRRFRVGFKMCFKDPQNLGKKKANKEKEIEEYWTKRHHFLSEKSLLALIRNGKELVAIGVVNFREMKALLENSVDVTFFDEIFVKRLFLEIGLEQTNLKAVQLSASFFAYAPILSRLQTISEFPFQEEMLHFSNNWQEVEAPSYLTEDLLDLIETLENLSPKMNLQQTLRLPKKLVLDANQKEAVVSSLRRRVALIQGPPGTGKSFCGAVLSKVINSETDENILCVCYTNHALDQFLENLIDFGLPKDEIVRLGGSEKMSDRIKEFTLKNLLEKQEDQERTQEERREVWKRRTDMDEAEREIKRIVEEINRLKNSNRFSDFRESLSSCVRQAFEIRQEIDGFAFVDEDGRRTSPDWLFQQWLEGRVLGRRSWSDETNSIWETSRVERLQMFEKWKKSLLEEKIGDLEHATSIFNEALSELDDIYRESKIDLLRSKSIIGCTTTGAANFAKELGALDIGVLIMEEAGEILEPHVITSLAANCKHLIMIGDHKQLRPKVNTYQLTVESGSPYEFNRSLFERLVLRGFPHVTLQLQHRMRPEISELVRKLTYPELRDAENVKNWPNLLGMPTNLVFIHHEIEEGSDKLLAKDENLSKINPFEVEMAVCITQFLLNQGYHGQQLVVLTPYLGQLAALRSAMSKKLVQVDLSEFDSAELNRFGLLEASNQGGGPIKPNNRSSIVRVSTVDSFQGEEADIVIASLVRSNKEGIVGFVGEPQRVNVLLSRARLGLILIGNMRTFEKAKSIEARQLWAGQLLPLLSKKRALFPGFPAHCSKHNQSFLLATPQDFSRDFGCESVCGKMLLCGRHKCQRKCHNSPHSETINDCVEKVLVACPSDPNHAKFEVECKFADNQGQISARCKAVSSAICQFGHEIRVSCYKRRGNFECSQCFGEKKPGETAKPKEKPQSNRPKKSIKNHTEQENNI